MSSSLNIVQLEANRRNAQQSTGPRTEAGKRTSSLNALRHGLTSRIVVLPTEDLTAYKTFSEEFLADLAPETFSERQCAQTIIDTQWRLNRVRTIEDGMLGLGHFGPETQIDPGHPEIHAALTAAAVYRGHSQAFVNLSMHEQRLHRILRDATKSLEEMKTKRIAARQTALDAAVAQHKLNKMQGLADLPNSDASVAGFVFKAEEIETEAAVTAAFWKPKSPKTATTTPKNSANGLPPREHDENRLDILSASASLRESPTICLDFALREPPLPQLSN